MRIDDRFSRPYEVARQEDFIRYLDKKDFLRAHSILSNMPVGDTPERNVEYLTTLKEGYSILCDAMLQMLEQIREGDFYPGKNYTEKNSIRNKYT